MARYNIYNNILIKVEGVFLKVEMEVDDEIAVLLNEHTKLKEALNNLKSKIEILSALKRSFNLYGENTSELKRLADRLFETLLQKQMRIRFLQEKEVLLNDYIGNIRSTKIPPVTVLNREYKLRKRLQETELLANFLSEDPRFSQFSDEITKENELFDQAIESGERGKLEMAAKSFQNYFEKVLNIYDVNREFLSEFKEFKTKISQQANSMVIFSDKEVGSLQGLQQTLAYTQQERLRLEGKVGELLYQYSMLQGGKKIILAELATVTHGLESVIFKDYGIKQRIQELKQYKIELNGQKNAFLREPSFDGYTQAVELLASIEGKVQRLITHKNDEKQNLINQFCSTRKVRLGKPFFSEVSFCDKMLFQVFHSYHISSHHKSLILQLCRPSRLLTTSSEKLFFQRRSNRHSFQEIEKTKKRFKHLIH